MQEVIRAEEGSSGHNGASERGGPGKGSEKKQQSKARPEGEAALDYGRPGKRQRNQ